MSTISYSKPREDKCDLCDIAFVCPRQNYFWIDENFRVSCDFCDSCKEAYPKSFTDAQLCYRHLQ